MPLYVTKRVIAACIVVVATTLFVFLLIRLTGDPALLLLPSDATPQDVVQLRHALGTDQPIWVQYARFLERASHGDFGTSFRSDAPAMQLVLGRVPATLVLAAVAFAITIVVAVPVGISSAMRPDSFSDAVGRVVALLGQGVPSFWLGIMLVLLLSVRLRWFPAFGGGGLDHLILPGITLGAYSTAITSRLLRSAMLETLGADYIRTARAKGLRNAVVVYKHALRNAAIPVVTVLGLQVGVLFGGAVITEYVFSYPGMGRLALEAISYRDFSVVQAFVLVVALVIAGANLAVDLLYGVIDPRIRYR